MPEETLTPGLKVGLLGGSFNPAHEGHRHISLMCLEAMELDCVWWMVSPGNPLKPQEGMASFDERLNSAREMARDPRIIVSDIETRLGTRYTADTLAALTRRHPEVHFVWLMGADNLAGFHRWQHWRDIAALVPIAVVDRPGATLKACRARAAVALAPYRVPEHRAGALVRRPPPAWVFLHGPRSFLSSTLLRAQKGRGVTGTEHRR